MNKTNTALTGTHEERQFEFDRHCSQIYAYRDLNSLVTQAKDKEVNFKDTFNGLAVLPYDNGSYTQAPFEDITEDKFLEMERHLNNIDLTKIIEITDETNLQDQAACAGVKCEIV